ECAPRLAPQQCLAALLLEQRDATRLGARLFLHRDATLRDDAAKRERRADREQDRRRDKRAIPLEPAPDQLRSRVAMRRDELAGLESLEILRELGGGDVTITRCARHRFVDDRDQWRWCARFVLVHRRWWAGLYLVEHFV